MKKLLVVVDMQNDFVTGPLGGEAAAKILPAMKERLERARKEGEEIVFTRDTHGEEYLSTQEGRKLPVLHCVKGSYGWQIADGLRREGEKIFDKPAFGSVALAEYIADGKFSEAEFIGVCTDICVVSNAILAKAYAPETEITVDGGLCAGTSEKAHEAALSTMRSCQITVR